MSDHGKTFRLRYVGARFEGKRLSVDVLNDLPAFRELLIAFARDAWRDANARRQRLPKGFDKSIALDLVDLEDGSAVPVLHWDRSTAQTMLPGFRDELEVIVDESFGSIMELISNAGEERYPRSLPVEHVRALNKFGAGLRDGERIEFLNTQDHKGNVVYLDNYRRKNLITRVRETYEARIEGSGTLNGAVRQDTFGGYIVIDTHEFGPITVKLEAGRVKDDFDGNMNADVQFDMLVELDSDDNFRSVVEVIEIALVDEEIGTELVRCRERLSELKDLRYGWHDGDGLPIAPEALDTAQAFLSKKYYLSKQYKIYPAPEGRILFEFESNGWDFSVEFAGDKTIEMYGVEIDGAGEMEPTVFQGLTDEFLKEFDRRAGK